MHHRFDSIEFSEKYSYSGELGAKIKNNRTEISIWTPIAHTVFVNLYFDSMGLTENDRSVKMERKENGVFSISFDGNYHGVYYTFTIKSDIETVETVDPYAASTNMNGTRGMIADMDSPLVCPDGWLRDRTVKLDSYCDAVILETHIRDFTSKTNAEGKCKFSGFTESGLKTPGGQAAGFDHLKELGITHVHLLPVAEYASVDQSRLFDENYNPYNWGYDPLHYNVPSGVYASAPGDGNAKIREMRQLVMNMHKEGIGVILDVVFNHTYDFRNPLWNVLPGYFYRTDENGKLTDGSGCGNEIASERPMARKFILDCLKMWMETYHVDGFRFDLMGLIDTDTVTEIEKLHKLNPSLILYGEGWIGGNSSLPASRQTNKWMSVQIKKTGCSAGPVAVFSDITRDSIKGPVFREEIGGYVNGQSYENVLSVKYASMGCTSPNFGKNWLAPNADNCISYVSSHDNISLFDKISVTVPSVSERGARSRLAGAIILTGRGIPFFMAGEEFLRTKRDERGNIVENSYNAPDFVNGINWSLKDTPEGEKTFKAYKKLIRLRKEHSLLRLSDGNEIEKATDFIIVEDRYDIIAYTLKGETETLLVIYNPLNEYEFQLPEGEWTGLYGVEGCYSGTVSLPEISCTVFKRK